jgi:hypothetical protein
MKKIFINLAETTIDLISGATIYESIRQLKRDFDVTKDRRDLLVERTVEMYKDKEVLDTSLDIFDASRGHEEAYKVVFGDDGNIESVKKLCKDLTLDNIKHPENIGRYKYEKANQVYMIAAMAKARLSK